MRPKSRCQLIILLLLAIIPLVAAIGFSIYDKTGFDGFMISPAFFAVVVLISGAVLTIVIEFVLYIYMCVCICLVL
jgi:hypothetical protein